MGSKQLLAAKRVPVKKEFWAAKSSWQQAVLVMPLAAKRVPVKKEFWAAK